jgi:hypothetical protein
LHPVADRLGVVSVVNRIGHGVWGAAGKKHWRGRISMGQIRRDTGPAGWAAVRDQMIAATCQPPGVFRRPSPPDSGDSPKCSAGSGNRPRRAGPLGRTAGPDRWVWLSGQSVGSAHSAGQSHRTFSLSLLNFGPGFRRGFGHTSARRAEKRSLAKSGEPSRASG